KLARSLVKKDFVASLRAAESAREVVDLVEDALGLREAESAPAESPPAESAAPAEAAPGESAETAATSDTTDAPGSDSAEEPRRVVAVTACPTGIAHTYMAADALVAAGSELGVEVVAETQGSSGTTPIDASVIEAADAVVFASDV